MSKPSYTIVQPLSHPSLGWFWLIPRLAFSLFTFAIAYFWQVKMTENTKTAVTPTATNAITLPVLAFTIFSLGFAVITTITFMNYLPPGPLPGFPTYTPLPQKLPTGLNLTEAKTYQVPLTDQKATLLRTLTFLKQQPQHQALLINAAIFYAQQNDPVRSQKYLDLAREINPNLTAFTQNSSASAISGF